MYSFHYIFRYDRDGEIASVPYPDDSALVFDIELLVPQGPYPTMATAVSSNAW